MKRTIRWLVGVVMLTSATARADAPGGLLVGGLVGAGAGWLIGRHVDGVSRGVSVPVGAVIGALVGRQFERRYESRRDRWIEVWRKGVAPDERPEAPTTDTSPLQPGVQLVRIPVDVGKGMMVTITIWKLGNRYVGPRGEVYTSLPSATDLALRYQLAPSPPPDQK